MKDAATDLIQSLPDSEHLLLFAARLQQWLIADLNRSAEPVPDFTESRARALLRAADLLDEPTRHSFERLVENEAALRVALYDLVAESGLAQNDEVLGLAAAAAAAEKRPSELAVDWPSLAIAAYAWNNEYALYQLDPASPPSAYSPAGQLLKQAAQFMRRQVQRSATEREKIGRTLAFVTGRPTALDNLQATGPVAPLPPYYRTPIPVKYPEVASHTIQVDPDAPVETGAISRGAPIRITDADLPPARNDASPAAPTYRQPIQVSGEETAPPQPTRVVTPRATVNTSAEFSRAMRRKIRRSKKAFKTTKLKVLVQELADGPGLYGVQVRIRCRGIRSYVAGTTSREGEFVCELPVPESTGLTYEVEVTWPRDFGGETERKSVTLNADRSPFTVPFYRHSVASEKA